MPIEIEVHTVPHFSMLALLGSKTHSIVNLGCLVHKMGLVWFHSNSTVVSNRFYFLVFKQNGCLYLFIFLLL